MNDDHADAAGNAGAGNGDAISRAGDCVGGGTGVFVQDRPDGLHSARGGDGIDQIEQPGHFPAIAADRQRDRAHRRVINGGQQVVADAIIAGHAAVRAQRAALLHQSAANLDARDALHHVIADFRRWLLASHRRHGLAGHLAGQNHRFGRQRANAANAEAIGKRRHDEFGLPGVDAERDVEQALPDLGETVMHWPAPTPPRAVARVSRRRPGAQRPHPSACAAPPPTG